VFSKRTVFAATAVSVLICHWF